MTRQIVTSEFNSFVGGLITEASPLTFPGNAALEINNFNIDKRGTISRRLGIDYENNFTIIDNGGQGGAFTNDVATRTFVWDNVGGNAALRFVVIRIGDKLDFFQTSGDSVSSGLILSCKLNLVPNSGEVDGTVVDGLFVLVGEAIDPTVFSFEDGVIIDGISGDLFTDLPYHLYLVTVGKLAQTPCPGNELKDGIIATQGIGAWVVDLADDINLIGRNLFHSNRHNGVRDKILIFLFQNTP